MLNKTLMAAALSTLALLSAPTYAKPAIQMDMVSEKEVSVQDGGKTVVKRVPASTSKAGEILIFTIHYQNKGDEKATRIEAKNRIPDGMVYVDNSAVGANSEIRFSIDGGKTFKKAGELTKEKVVDGKKEVVKATPADYTNIEWIISEIGAGQSGELGYRALLQ